MRSETRTLRARNHRRSPSFRPGTAVLEGRLLLAVGDVLTFHNSVTTLPGVNNNETTLTPTNVNPTGFGKLFTDPVDGNVYGQPLYVSSVAVPGQGTHNVVYVTTQHDSVYAFDATSGAQLWHDNFINPAAGITTVPSPADTGSTDINPEVGITATPTIDAGSGTMYVVAKTKEVHTDGSVHYVQTLHALDISTGAEKLGGPAVIGDTTYNTDGSYTYNVGATVPGTGDNSVNGVVHFNAGRQNERSGLFLSNGVLYTSWSSHGDNGPYSGWLIGYDPATLKQVVVFNAAPNGNDNAIWAGGASPQVDANGNIYFVTGNGTFDAAPNGAQSLGAGGGGLGYQGIGSSVAVKFDAYKPSGNHSSTGLYLNGDAPGLPPVGPGDVYNDLAGTGIDFNGGAQASPPHTFQAALTYDGTTLKETITDLTTKATTTFSYTVNIAQQVGGNTAYVGFTGGSGGLTAVQDVNTWTYTSGSTTVDHSAGFASNSDLTSNGNASFTGGAAQLTDGGGSEAGSIFTNARVPVTSFSTTFTFQMKPGSNPIADGMTFTVQANPGGKDYGSSVVRLNPAASGGPTVVDFFTPFNQAALSAADLDQGSGAVLLLPDSVGSTATPHLLVQAGKDGNIYLINRDNMGGFNSTTNNVVQEVSGAFNGEWGAPVYFNGAIYYGGQNDNIKEFSISNGQLSTTPVAQTTNTFGYPGTTPSISANGTSNGIVWSLDVGSYGIPEAPTAGPGVLYAYDASTLQELYSSSDVFGRDTLGNAIKFTTPTISHGFVYVGSAESFSAFGLLPPAVSKPSAPTTLQARPASDMSIRLDWVDTATNATLIKVERSTGGGDYTVVATVGPKVATYTDTGLDPSTKYSYKLVATNQLGDSGASNTASATTLVAPPVLQVFDVVASQIDLSWTATAHNHYTLERSTDGVNFTQIARLSKGVTTYQDSNISFGTYYYRVTAFDGVNDSAVSNVVSATYGPVNSHIDHSNGFANHNDLTANGSTTYVTSGLSTFVELTDGGGSEAGTVFTTGLQSVSTFDTTFTFRQHDGSNPQADGMTFIIQGNSPQALGPGGGGLGYGPDSPSGTGGIPNSIAVKFDLYNNQGEGTNSTGLFIDGDSPTIAANPRDTLAMIDPTVVDLHSQDVMSVNLTYDGTTLTETLTDTVTNKTFTTSYKVDIPTIIGNGVAYVGFGGGTGGLTSVQDVQTWTYDSVDDPTKIHDPKSLKVASLDRQGANKSTATIDWKANDNYNATGVYLQRSTDGVNFTTIAVVSPNYDTYTDKGLTAGTYYYRVQSFNATTTSAFSNVDSVLVGGGDNPAVVDYSGGFANHPNLTATGSATFAVYGSTTVARLTDGGANEGGNVFTTQRVGVSSFDTTFAMQIHGGTAVTGDGLTFIIQGNTPTTAGPGGGGLGYGPDHVGGSGGIPNSIAIKFDTFNNQGEGNNSTGLFVNGDAPTIPTGPQDTLVKLDPSVINLSSGDTFLVDLHYDGKTLQETITDTVTNKTFTTSYTVDIPADVGGNVGYIGFGAGTGGNTAVQDILAWIYTTPAPAPTTGASGGLAVLIPPGDAAPPSSLASGTYTTRTPGTDGGVAVPPSSLAAAVNPTPKANGTALVVPSLARRLRPTQLASNASTDAIDAVLSGYNGSL